MSTAFGLNRFAQAFAVAVSDAGERIADKPISCVDRLAFQLFEWGQGKELDVTFRFVYPFVGGTAVAHSFNLANPATGRIDWEGGVTHSANGITGDGVSGAGRTNMTLAGPLQADAFVSCGIYSRTANQGTYCEIGNYTTTGILIYCRWTTALPIFYNGTVGLAPTGVANSQGLFCSLRGNAAGFFCYRNGVLLSSNTSANAAVSPPVPFMIVARPSDDPYDPESEVPQSAQLFSTRNLAFAFLSNAVNTPGVGAIFSTPKQAELYSHVQSFQTKLGRQV